MGYGRRRGYVKSMVVLEVKRKRIHDNLPRMWRSGRMRKCGATRVLFRSLIDGLVGFGCDARDGVIEWMIGGRRRRGMRMMSMRRRLIGSVRKRIGIGNVVVGVEGQENGIGWFLGWDGRGMGNLGGRWRKVCPGPVRYFEGECVGNVWVYAFRGIGIMEKTSAWEMSELAEQIGSVFSNRWYEHIRGHL